MFYYHTRIRRNKFEKIAKIICEVFEGEQPENYFAYQNNVYTGSLWNSYTRIRREYKECGVITTRNYSKIRKIGKNFIKYQEQSTKMFLNI